MTCRRGASLHSSSWFILCLNRSLRSSSNRKIPSREIKRTFPSSIRDIQIQKVVATLWGSGRYIPYKIAAITDILHELRTGRIVIVKITICAVEGGGYGE